MVGIVQGCSADPYVGILFHELATGIVPLLVLKPISGLAPV